MKIMTIVLSLLICFLNLSIAQDSDSTLLSRSTENQLERSTDSTQIQRDSIPEERKKSQEFLDVSLDSAQTIQSDSIASETPQKAVPTEISLLLAQPVQDTDKTTQTSSNSVLWTIFCFILFGIAMVIVARRNRGVVARQIKLSERDLQSELLKIRPKISDELAEVIDQLRHEISSSLQSQKQQLTTQKEKEKKALVSLEKQIDKILSHQSNLTDLVNENLNGQKHFLTPFPINENLESLGEYLTLETSKKEAIEFTGKIHQINASRDRLVTEIEALNTQEQSQEDEIIEQSLSRLRKYRSLLEAIAELTLERYELASKNRFVLDQKDSAMSADERNQREQRIEFLEMIGGKLLTRLTDSGLVRPFKSAVGDRFDNSLHMPVATEVENSDPAKNLTIYASYAPGLKMGEEIIARQRVQLYRVATGATSPTQTIRS